MSLVLWVLDVFDPLSIHNLQNPSARTDHMVHVIMLDHARQKRACCFADMVLLYLDQQTLKTPFVFPNHASLTPSMMRLFGQYFGLYLLLHNSQVDQMLAMLLYQDTCLL